MMHSFALFQEMELTHLDSPLKLIINSFAVQYIIVLFETSVDFIFYIF